MQTEQPPPAVDEDLFSRQLYALGGVKAQQRIGSCRVLLIGLRGTGVEIAKNLILMGVQSCELVDPEPTTWMDLSAQFYLTETDAAGGLPRAAACAARLAELNENVRVVVAGGAVDGAMVARADVVVCTDASGAEMARVGALARAAGKAFVAAEARGGFGRLFCDFGEGFVVEDKDGEEAKTGLLELITSEEVGKCTVVEHSLHGLEDGDAVAFSEVRGMAGLNGALGAPPHVVRVVDPRTFSIGDTRGAGAYLGPGGRFTQVKLPRTLDFSPLAAMLAPVGAPGGPPDASAFLTTDWAKLERPVLLHAAFYALHGLPGGLPAPGDEAAVAAAVAAAGTALGAPLGEADAAVVRQLARGARGSLAPLTAALGGVAAQEVIKASTHRLTPVKQWVYFDVAEALPPGEPAPPLPAVDVAPRGDRYDGQACVLGRAMQGALGGLRYFLVGAGAIGCEILKNWALMGVGAGPGGMVTVTDMDRIERSNLSRQFLFRAGDVKKPKSSTAVLAAARMNPALRGRAFEVKAGPETEGLFNDAFWKGLSGACNALDNGPARLYVDSRCVRFNKPLLESGTLGTFGSTQVVVPGLTEHYGATVDPPEKGIPVCTLKSFPYLIEHTLVWARDWFEGEFAMLPAAINAYISDPAFLDKLALQPGQQIETLQRLLAALVKEKPTTVEDCVKWARLRFAAAYHDDMLQLLHNFPADKVNSDGQPFWNQTNKRVPHAVHFDDGDATCMDFVRAVTELRAAMFGLRVDPAMHTPEWYRQALAAVKVPAFQALSGVKIAASEKEAEELKAAEAAGGGGGAATGGGGGGGGGWDATSVAEGLIAQLPKPSDLAGFRCFEAEFEKDDDLHITAVTASSNLRARAYTIAEQGKFESKRIAGKVIPAIATTTAFVSGVICAELYKLTKGGLPLESFRSSGNNLAVPVFGFSEPVGLQFKRNKLTLPTRATFAPQPPALPLEPAEGGTKVWKWSVWDANVDVQGPLTMQGLLDFVATTFGRDDVESIGFGTTILHTTMAFMKKAQKEARLKATPAQLVKQIQKDQAPDFSKVRAIELPVNTRSDDEMGQLPTLLYHISSDELAAIGVVVAEGEPPVPAAVTPAAAADGAA